MKGEIRKLSSDTDKIKQILLARYVLIITTTLLLMLGLIMVLSASSVDAIDVYGNPFHIFLQQLIWMVIGVIAAGMIMNLANYKNLLKRYCLLMMIVGYVLLIAVLIPGIGVRSQGSARWLGIGILHIQPSELIKFVLIVFGSLSLSNLRKPPRRLKDGIAPTIFAFLIAAVLIMLQPDMGTTMVLLLTLTGLLIAAGASLKLLMKFGVVLTVGALAMAIAAPYRRQRLLSFWNPFAHPFGSGYQILQSLVSLGSGHIFGDGLGASTAKWGFLPNDHTDFIFAVIGQELGLVGDTVILLLFAALIWAGFRIAFGLKDKFSYLLVIGLTCWIAAQSIINIGAVIGVLPVTGIPLPFVSFGGSSLVINLVAIGLILAASREAVKSTAKVYVKKRAIRTIA